MKKTIATTSLCALFIFLITFFFTSYSYASGQSYKSILKEWTRHESVFSWDNMEAQVIWHATYFSDEFRTARLNRLSGLYDWSDSERVRQEREDQIESKKYDVFFITVYAGSSRWPEIGKDTGLWRIVLETGKGQQAILPLQFERVAITQVERTLYPQLDKWSQAYILRFSKTHHEGQSFRLKMNGIPAKSELVW